MLNLVEKLRGLAKVDAPKREVKIAFQIPASLSQESPPDLDKLQVPRRDPEHAYTVDYMNVCRKEARQLSRCNLPLAKRMQLNEAFMPHVLPVVERHVQTYAREGGIPDDDRRHETLELTMEVLRQLIESYKIVFKKLYAGSDYAYVTNIKHAETSAFRVLELTKLLQRVMALRYQVLNAQQWVVVNTVFHAMAASGQADTEADLLPDFSAEKDPPKTGTLRGLFLGIHMIARFDVLRWPTEWQEFIFSYARSVGYLADSAEDKGGELPRHCSIAYCYDTLPSRQRRSPSEAELGPATLINWAKLHKKVTGDFLTFFTDAAPRTELSYFQKRLAALSYNECLALVQLQFECVTNENPQPAVDVGRGEACDMRIFIGFRSVYQLLENIHRGKYGVGTRLADALAKRSAVFAEDHVATVESVWYLQFQDADVIRLKTQETKFTTSMRIGMMAAYGVGNEGIAKPQFGLITRIYRPSPQSVIVDILKYGSYTEPVIVTTDLDAFGREDRKVGNLLGAILVLDATGETKLLLPPLSTLRENTRLAVRRDRIDDQLLLGKKQVVTRDFFLFRLANAAA